MNNLSGAKIPNIYYMEEFNNIKLLNIAYLEFSNNQEIQLSNCTFKAYRCLTKEQSLLSIPSIKAQRRRYEPSGASYA